MPQLVGEQTLNAGAPLVLNAVPAMASGAQEASMYGAADVVRGAAKNSGQSGTERRRIPQECVVLAN